MLGETIKDWKLVGKLGKGGMGEVWSAEQQIVKTRVAIKLLVSEVSKDRGQVQRFFNEAIAVSKIKHSGIAKIFDVGFATIAGEQRAYLVMELLEGEALAARLARTGRLPIADVLDLGGQIGSVLAATHAAGVTHRDLKPDNIFVVPDAEVGERAKILDFGIAKLGGDATGMTTTGSSMGTPAYMAPEQWNDAASATSKSDVYAFGCLLFEMATGRPPFVVRSVGEACTKHLTETPVRVRSLVPTLPAALDDIVARMLEKQAADRPPLDEVVRAIEQASAQLSPESVDRTVASPVSMREAATTTLGGAAAEAQVPPPKRRAWLAVVAGLVLVGGAGAFVAMSSGSQTSTVAPAAAPVEQPAPPLKVPTSALATLALYRDPQDSAASTLGSESLWAVTRDEFAEACKQPGAEARWCAAREFAAGQVALAKPDEVAAETAYRTAIALDATFALPHVALSGLASNQGQHDAALEHARAAERLDGAAWTSIAASARAYAAADKLDDAITEYLRALAKAPDNAALKAEIALAYHAAGMDTEAAKYGDEAFARDRALFALRLRKAELLVEQGQAQQALELADAAVASNPKQVAAHLVRGDALALLKRKDEAFAAYRKAIELRAKRPLAEKEPRFVAVEAALASDRLPPPRVNRDRTRIDRLQRDERLKGVKISPRCMENPLAQGCS